MPLDSQILDNIIMGATALGIAFLAVFWLSLIIWTYRDMRSRARNLIAPLLAAIVVTLLFLPGIVIYLILRPPYTLEEEYQHTLEEEALLQSIEDAPVCPGCGRRIKDAWIVCPTCHTKLKKTCQQCQQLMELSWNLCPYCGTPVPGRHREDQAVSEITHPISIAEETAAHEVHTLK